MVSYERGAPVRPGATPALFVTHSLSLSLTPSLSLPARAHQTDEPEETEPELDSVHLTQSVVSVVLQKSIPTQIRQFILHISSSKG